ncbi:MAG: LytTR family DNA-binding domain-containing protein [Clostridiales bacterium]|nr:LytTR family DNA-binding domain-containing protein [Clostridiales bacterium]
MKLAILEDNPEDADLLIRACETWAGHSETQITCDRFSSGEDFLALFEPGYYQLVFLDIYMEDLTGIDVAKQIREKDMDCLLVFVTTSAEHVWDSLPLHPFDYLIKPCRTERAAQVLTDAAKVLPQNTASLELTCGRKKISVAYSDLISLEADRHHAIVTAAKRDPLRCYIDSFASLWDTLRQDSRFLLCNRGIILNMDYIEKLGESEFIMKSGQAFPIRHNNRNEVTQAFLTYQYERTRKYGKRYL